jgi:predicted phage gp36 major capsid-like protein
MPGKGFAALSEDERKQISSMGGRAAQAVGTAHRFTSEEARAAGRKGGAAVHAKRKEEARLRGHAPKGGYSIDSGGERVWDPALPDRPEPDDDVDD